MNTSIPQSALGLKCYGSVYHSWLASRGRRKAHAGDRFNPGNRSSVCDGQCKHYLWRGQLVTPGMISKSSIFFNFVVSHLVISFYGSLSLLQLKALSSFLTNPFASLSTPSDKNDTGSSKMVLTSPNCFLMSFILLESHSCHI